MSSSLLMRRAEVRHRAPRIAVCGINPHAGENGLFGYGEEEEKVIPGVEKAQAEGIQVVGPPPADTLFFRTVRGDFDIVVAMYHDQDMVPSKCSAWFLTAPGRRHCRPRHRRREKLDGSHPSGGGAGAQSVMMLPLGGA